MPRSKEELSKLTIVELKAALKAAGKPLTGKKDELVERLFETEQAAAAPTLHVPAAAPVPAAEAAAAPTPAPAASIPAPGIEQKAPEAPAATEVAEEKPSKRAKIVFTETTATGAAQTVTLVVPASTAPPSTTQAHLERLKNRQERFKDPDVEKAKQRAQRFGTFNEDLERERAKKRAERFGTFNPDIEAERLAKRAERFGVEENPAKLAARAARFGLPSGGGGGGGGGAKGVATAKAAAVESPAFEALKQARAARFGLKA